MGTRWKVWLEDPRGNLWVEDPEVPKLLWLFKAVRCKDLPDGTRRCFEEDWAEFLATEIATHLGMPAAQVRMAYWSGMDGILTLDALIANTDRHHENWGALARGSERWLAPTFDQGTCLGFEGSDEMRLRYLEQASGHGMDLWVRRGRSNHFEGRPGLVELAAEALQRVPAQVARHWLERVEAFDLEWWRDTLESVPQHRMSHPARNFAFEVVRLNRERLLDVHRSH